MSSWETVCRDIRKQGISTLSLVLLLLNLPTLQFKLDQVIEWQLRIELPSQDTAYWFCLQRVKLKVEFILEVLASGTLIGSWLL